MSFSTLRYGILLLLLVVGEWLVGEPAAAAELQRPAGLERDIEFWRRVFAEITTSEGFVHDDQRLDVVYEIVRLPDRNTNANRRDISSAATKKYAALLLGLSKGKRSGLSPDEKRVLALWGPDVDNQTLAVASARVRFQLGQADRFKSGLVRSGLWESFIERTLADAGVPAELLALPHVESGYDPTAQSHAGAAGLWQFMPATARDYMRLDAVVDDRMDPYRATESAARLLRHNFGVTGSWPTAITAYNHGAGGMRRAIAEMGTSDIEVIVRRYRGRAFGFASRNFYVSFLAAADVRANAERYFGKLDRANPDASLAVDLPDYAPVDALEEALGIDRATLARLNPSLRPPVWDGSKHIPRGHRLYVPQRPGIDPAQLLASIPRQRWAGSQVTDAYHVVRPGESLSAIAPRYGARVSDLVALNRLANPHSIRAGQRLILPAGRGAAATTVATATPVRATPVAAASSGPATAVPVVAVRMVADADRPPAVASRPPAPSAIDQVAVAAAATLPDSLAIAYAVAPDGSIRVSEGETLGLYAAWLATGVDAVRRHKGLAPSAGIRVGATLKLPFGKVDRQTFEASRLEHHRKVRADFLARHRIEGTLEHQVRAGESAWLLAERRYRIPVWLLREYNPGIDLAQVRPGTRMVIPRVSRSTG